MTCLELEIQSLGLWTHLWPHLWFLHFGTIDFMLRIMFFKCFLGCKSFKKKVETEDLHSAGCQVSSLCSGATFNRTCEVRRNHVKYLTGQFLVKVSLVALRPSAQG